MKTIYLILLLPIVLLLAGCGNTTNTCEDVDRWIKYEELKIENRNFIETEAVKIQRLENDCDIVGYSLDWDRWNNRYVCISDKIIRAERFENCAKQCEKAVDDYRDVSNIGDMVTPCLKLCMGES